MVIGYTFLVLHWSMRYREFTLVKQSKRKKKFSIIAKLYIINQTYFNLVGSMTNIIIWEIQLYNSVLTNSSVRAKSTSIVSLFIILLYLFMLGDLGF